jgi:serine/threonine protein kinase
MSFKIYIGYIIGLWKIKNIISSVRDTYILLVEPINNNYENTIEWIMKYRYDSVIDEYSIYIKYNLDKCEYALKIPSDNMNTHDRYNFNSWYIIESYDSDIGDDINFAYENIDKLVICVINFLKYIHCNKNIIHGDIKLKNILYKKKSNILFKVCDYESLAKPELDSICKKDKDGSYYYYLGCDPNESYLSFRMDLEAFGTILWHITNKINKNDKMNWQKKALEYYDLKNKISSEGYQHLEILKNESILNQDEIIKTYFKIISKISWKEVNKPDENVYDEIIELFKKKI